MSDATASEDEADDVHSEGEQKPVEQVEAEGSSRKGEAKKRG